MLTYFKKVKKHLVNDWALLQLVQNISKQLLPNASQYKLMAWYIMVKLGYKMQKN